MDIRGAERSRRPLRRYSLCSLNDPLTATLTRWEFLPVRVSFGNAEMDERRLLSILEPMMAEFKREIADMRKAGASQAEIDAMLDRFEEIYAPDHDDEGKLVVAVLREAAKSPDSE
jgi:hypothetical protein